jgi:UPF0176 protein
MTQVVATFYKFVDLPDYQEKQASLLNYCQTHQVKGTILLASEGINGTIAACRHGIDQVLLYLKSDPLLADLTHRESLATTPPFERMKVKLKKEIVTLGVSEVNPNEQVGTYVTSQEWNNLIEDPEVLVIDTRNSYEVDIGSFKNAVNPNTHSFREFPDYVNHHLNPNQYKKVAMFCTGGIRCEKASSFLLKQGFTEVYHLKGGILKYLEEITPDESLWEGECFVFDERVAVTHGLAQGTHDMCLACGHPINDTDQASPHYEDGISCPYCYESLTPEKYARQQERKQQQ